MSLSETELWKWATQIKSWWMFTLCTDRTTSAPTNPRTVFAPDKIGVEPWARGGMGPSAQQN